jgi:hypothetical protein
VLVVCLLVWIIIITIKIAIIILPTLKMGSALCTGLAVRAPFTGRYQPACHVRRRRPEGRPTSYSRMPPAPPPLAPFCVAHPLAPGGLGRTGSPPPPRVTLRSKSGIEADTSGDLLVDEQKASRKRAESEQNPKNSKITENERNRCQTGHQKRTAAPGSP